MGIRVPTPDPPYGTDCPVCTPVLFPPDKTPEFVYVYFSGVENCGKSEHVLLNGSSFRCAQMDGYPCIWYHDGDVWVVNFYALRPGYDYSFVTCHDCSGWCFFSGKSSACPPDLTVFDNDQASCILQYAGAGGTALVSYFDVASWLVEQFGLESGKDLFHELFVHPDGDVILKFCNIAQSTNVKIRFSP